MSDEGRFPQTSWTLIDRLKKGGREEAARALDEICVRYRYPLYCYLRRRGLDHHDAEDVLHDFLVRFIDHDSFGAADEAKGRLRGFLSTSIGRFLGEWRRHRARRPHLPAAAPDAGADFDRLYDAEQVSDAETPDQLFERKWAVTLLHRALDRLGDEFHQRGRGDLFDALRPVLLDGGSLRGNDATGIAARLGMTDEALRAALHRLLRDFRDHLRAEVRQTVENPSDIDGEIVHLMQAFEG